MTYDDVAARFGLKICPAYGTDDCSVSPEDHSRGVALPNEGVIHWRPRNLTRPGLRRFLMVVARVRVLHWFLMNTAMRIYASNVWANSAAKEMHIRFSSSYSRSDRLKVRWLSSQGMTITDSARRWAERKEKAHAD